MEYLDYFKYLKFLIDKTADDIHIAKPKCNDCRINLKLLAMKSINTLFLTTFMLLLFNSTMAQTTEELMKECPPQDADRLLIKNNRLKALFLYLFTDEVEFKGRNENKEFKVAFLNSEGVKKYFDKIIAVDSDRSYTTETIDNLKSIKKYQMVFIDCNYDIDLIELNRRLGNSKTLIVTDNEIENDLMLNFTVNDCKIKYTVNKEMMAQQKLIPSPKLLSSAL